MKRKLLGNIGLSLLLAASVTVLSGCGGSKEGSGSGTSGSTGGTSAGAAQSVEQAGEGMGEKITLRYSFWGSTNEKDAITKSCEAFMEQNPDIEVELIHIPADYEAKLSAMIAGGEEPDLANLKDFFAVPLAESGKLYNIFDLMDQDEEIDREDYLQFAYRYFTPDKAYGLNTAGELFAMFYNKELFEAAGVPGLPDSIEEALTMDEFIQLAKQLTLDGAGRNAADPAFDPSDIVQYGLMFDFGAQQYMGAVYSNEGSYVNDDGTKWTLNEGSAVEALQTISDLVNVHHVAPNPAELKALPSLAVALQTNKAAMIWAGAWVALDLGLGETEFDVGVLPVFKKGVYATCPAQGTAGIFASTKHPEETFRLWKWMMDPKNSIDLFASGLWMPILADYYTDEALLNTWATVQPAHPSGYIGSHVDVVLADGVKANPSSYVKNYTEINALVTPALESAFLGNESVKEALDRIAPDVEKLLSGRYDR